jgi:hypothetical protein
LKIEQPTADEYKSWVNDKVTCWVRNVLIQERQNLSSLDNSKADFTVNGNDDYDLQKIGLDSAMRMAVVKGIDLFTDYDQFYAEHFPESEAKDAEL